MELPGEPRADLWLGTPGFLQSTCYVSHRTKIQDRAKGDDSGTVSIPQYVALVPQTCSKPGAKPLRVSDTNYAAGR